MIFFIVANFFRNFRLFGSGKEFLSSNLLVNPMAFSIKDVISSMRDSFSPFDEGTGHFIQLNVEQAKLDLKLAERAAEDGQKGLPRLSRTSKDALAEDVDNYLSHAISLAKEKVQDYLQAIDELSVNQSEGSQQQITEIFDAATSELKTTARNYYTQLFSLRRRWIRGEDQLDDFRAKNRLIGPARYPVDTTKTFGIIFLILVIELIVNAYALGAAHPEGPLGVIVEIVMFGIANIGLAYLLGTFIWRYFFHVEITKKLVAYLLAPPLMACLLLLNFLLAHYRDALSRVGPELSLNDLLANVQQLGAQAVASLTTSPFLLQDFKSYLLLFVGILASIIATKKSFDLDDAYPGYGKIERDQDRFATQFNTQQDYSLKDLDELVQYHSEQINQELALLRGNEQAIINRRNDIKRLYERYDAWLESIHSSGRALYAFYKDANIKSRKSSKEPKCFIKHKYALPRSAKIRRSVETILVPDYGHVEVTCERYIKKLNRQLTKYKELFRDIDRMSRDKVLDSQTGIPTIFRD